MDKLDYLLRTSRGNYDRHMDRFSRRIRFTINQETYSKDSMLPREKLRFQQKFSDLMHAQKRRAFRGNVVLQMDFYPSKGNPPSIHKLPKNYLDLLWRPVEGLLNPNLPLKDDRQISILIVNYHVQKANKEPRIEIEMAPLRDFYDDLHLYDRINSYDFPGDEENPRYDLENVIQEEDYPRLLDQSIVRLDELKDLEDFVDLLEVYQSLRNIYLFNYQSAFFGIEKIKTSELIVLLLKNKPGHGLIAQFLSENRKLIISHSFSPLKAIGLPTRRGETDNFKDTVRRMITEFKERYPSLFPLRVNLNLTILYVPPSRQEMDLDNLAMNIVPYLNEALKPPAGHWFHDYQRPRGFPAHTIIQYQIIKIPRDHNDPEDGTVRLILGKYEPYKNCWKDVERTIDLWSNEVF